VNRYNKNYEEYIYRLTEIKLIVINEQEIQESLLNSRFSRNRVELIHQCYQRVDRGWKKRQLVWFRLSKNSSIRLPSI